MSGMNTYGLRVLVAWARMQAECGDCGMEEGRDEHQCRHEDGPIGGLCRIEDCPVLIGLAMDKAAESLPANRCGNCRYAEEGRPSSGYSYFCMHRQCAMPENGYCVDWEGWQE